MKQNAGPVVGEVPESPGIGLDELDGADESFLTGIGDAMLGVVEQTLLMAAQHFHDLLHRGQLAAHGVIPPSLEVASGCSALAVQPELREVLLDLPGPAGLQIELRQC